VPRVRVDVYARDSVEVRSGWMRHAIRHVQDRREMSSLRGEILRHVVSGMWERVSPFEMVFLDATVVLSC
jgi:hypothetical protein